MMTARLVSTSLITLCIWGLIPAPASAQTGAAMLRGRVADTDGAGLPGVIVVIKSATAPGGAKEVITDIEGNYRISLLPPASDYYITINYPGFSPVELGPLDLDSGKSTIADLTMRSSAESTETVKVEARGSTVDTESTRTSTTYNSEFIEGLPIIGHNYQDILTLAPGVTDTDGDGNPNVHGSRATGLQYRLDGGNITDPVSGGFGQNLNQDIIEEIEIITAGASAEYGRADGGFANITTKSGGNEFEAKLSLYWQGKFLNGNGANNNDVTRFRNEYPDYQDLRSTLSLGGAIVKDRLWYFASVEVLDTERPVNQVGADILTTSRGIYSFAKATWQVDSFNKLALQVVGDPATIRGRELRLGVSPDSDYELTQGGLTPQLKWTSTISPQLLFEANITHFDSGIAITPVSRFFEPQQIDLIIDPDKTNSTIQALYPCSQRNCDPALGERDFYQDDLLTGRVNGPFFFQNDDSRIRDQVKSDLTYNLPDAWGQHTIKAGIEIANEKFADQPTNNPILTDVTSPRVPDPTDPSLTLPDQVDGYQGLQTFLPLSTPQRAAGFNTSLYLMDGWRPRHNLTVHTGVRIDREEMDTSGFGFFDPRTERRRSIKLWWAVCEAAALQGLVFAGSNCQNRDTYDGRPPTQLPNDQFLVSRAPAELAELDVDGDGYLNLAVEPDRNALFEELTSFTQRETENFSIVNTNISPRFSISWDPWADGKTRLFGSLSRYYDRLYLSTVTDEIGPDSVTFTFFPDPLTHRIEPGAISNAASTVSITQVDRGLRTPRTDELTLGFEREVATEWSVGLTYIKREGRELLQDVDLNHFTCAQARAAIGIDPYSICGDGGQLETDRFGVPRRSVSGPVAGGDFAFDFRSHSLPNDVPDLYTVNSGFNQVLRIGNLNSSRYIAYEAHVTRRLHRNWQMQASYTWSKAYGQAEEFSSGLGNDPQTKDDEEGFLDYDQRHLLNFQGVTRLSHGILLGGVVRWSSGTPYSVVRRINDGDSTGNLITQRVFYPSGRRNDQRSPGSWRIDARLEKSFPIGKVQAAAFLNVENLLNTDDLTIGSYNIEAFGGVGLDAGRDPGRRFELGASLVF